MNLESHILQLEEEVEALQAQNRQLVNENLQLSALLKEIIKSAKEDNTNASNRTHNDSFSTIH